MESDVLSSTEPEDFSCQDLTSSDELSVEKKVKSQRTRHFCSYLGCDVSFSRPSRLANHVRIHTGERPFACSAQGCNKTYTRSSHLKRHVQNSHVAKRNKIENGDVSSDEDQNEERDTIKCDYCPKMFQSKYSLKKHQIVAHGKDSKRYPCEKCGMTFAKKSWLKHHVAQHTGEFPHKCPKCSKTFKYPKKLRAHMTVHNYKCETCDIKFEAFSEFRKHMATQHQPEEKRICPICQVKFTNRSQLRQHYVTHGDVREVFTCHYATCQRTYYHERNLKQHVKAYHEGNRFPCSIEGCQAKLFSRGKLVSHMKNMHQGEKKQAKVRKPPSSTKKLPKKPMAAFLTGASLPREIEREMIKHQKVYPLKLEDLQEEILAN